MNIKKSEIFSLSQDYVLQEIEVTEGKMFYLFNIKTGEIYRLNQTAFEFLSLIDKQKTLEEIIEVLDKKYGIGNDLLWRDFKPLIIEWQETAIINKKIEKGGEPYGKV